MLLIKMIRKVLILPVLIPSSLVLHLTAWAQILPDTTTVVTVPANASFRQYNIGGIWGDSTAAGPAIDSGIEIEPGTSVIIEARGTIAAHGIIARMDPDGYIVSGYTIGGVTDSIYTTGQRVPEIEVATELPVEPGFFGQLIGLFVDPFDNPVDSAFVIGSRKSLEAPTGAARLLFAINDDGYVDNVGSFQVVTSVILPHPDLSPINPDNKPEAHLIFSWADSSQGLIYITSVIHNNGNKDASNVLIQFWMEDITLGSTEMIQIGEDQRIPLIGKGQADSAKVIWHPEPISNHYRIYVYVDPQNAIEEFWEDDNVATFTFEGITPGNLKIEAEFDGNDSEDIVGTFLSGMPPSVYVPGIDVYNTFTLIADRPYAISKVSFEMKEIGKRLVDTNPSDGWQATFNMAELNVGRNSLKVTVYDLSGYALPPEVIFVETIPFAPWLRDHPQDLEASFHEDGGGHYTISFHPVVELLDYTVDKDVFYLGNKKNMLVLDPKISMQMGLNRDIEITDAKGILKVLTFSENADQSFNLPATIREDMSFEGGRYYYDFPRRTIVLPRAHMHYSFVVWIIPVDIYVFMGADLFSKTDLRVSLDSHGNFVPVTEVSSTVGFRFEFILNVLIAYGLAQAYVETDPNAELTVHVSYTTQEGIRPYLSGFIVWPYHIYARFLWEEWRDSGQFGPNYFSLGTAPLYERVQPKFGQQAPLALFPHPHVTSSRTDSAIVVWIHNVGTDSAANPEVYGMFWNGTQWGVPQAITNNDRFETNPKAAFTPSGDVIAVWTQNRLAPGQSEDPAYILSQQDIYYAYWDHRTSQWTMPRPITDDDIGDGMPAISLGADGKGLVLWTRTLDNDLATRTDWEIYYAQWKDSSWSEPRALTNDNSADCSVDIACSDDSVALAVWLRDGDGDFGTIDDTEIFSALWNGTNWGSPTQLTFNDQLERTPSVAFIPNGDALAVWSSTEIQPDSTLIDRIYCSRWDRASSRWDNPEVVVESSQFLLQPKVSTSVKDSNLIAMVMFRGYDGYDGDLFACMKNLSIEGSQWTTPTPITADTLTDWMASSTIDARNNALFVSVKTDLSRTTPQAKLGNFQDGLSIVAKGIKADLSLSDELNFTSLPIAPDLDLQGRDIRFDVPLFKGGAYASAGDTIGITARVHNLGGFIAESVKLRFFDGHPDSGGIQIGGDILIERILADSLESAQMEWVATPGVHKIYVAVDPENTISELKESNNLAFQLLYVVPDVAVSEIRFSNTNPALNDTIKITGVVENLSGATASNVIIRFFKGDPEAGGIQIGPEQSIPTLPVGSRDSVSVNYRIPGGIDTIYAVLHYPSGPEKDETNNQRFAVLTVLPDLAIDSDLITFAEDDSGLYVLKAEVHNRGGVEALNVPVQFFEGNPLSGGRCIDSTSVDAISAFGSQVAQISWQPHYGSNLVYVQVNPDKRIAERNFNNNRASREFFIRAKADLAIDSSDIYFSNPSPTVGDQVEITVIVHNLGRGFANGVVVECLDGTSIFAGTRIGQETIVSIPPDQSDTLRFLWNTKEAAPGEHEIFVYVDPDNLVFEANEGNNSASKIIPVVTGISLTHFGCTVKENNVILQWKVQSQETLAGFTVERSSDGLTYQSIGYVPAATSPMETTPYRFMDRNLSIGYFYYRLKVIDSEGTITYTQPIGIQISPPSAFRLLQNYPNPFNAVTRIGYHLPKESQVTILILNLLGQKIKTLVDAKIPAGYYSVTWDGSDDRGHKASSGIYLVRMEAGSFVDSKKLTLIK